MGRKNAENYSEEQTWRSIHELFKKASTTTCVKITTYTGNTERERILELIIHVYRNDTLSMTWLGTVTNYFIRINVNEWTRAAMHSIRWKAVVNNFK